MAVSHKTLFDTLHRAFHERGSELFIRTERVVWVAIVLSIVIFAIELQLPIDTPWHRTLTMIDGVFLIGFAIELALRVISYRPPELRLFRLGPANRVRLHLMGRLRFLLRPMQLIDLLTVLALIPVLRGLRALRLLRLLRSGNIFRYSHPLRGVGRAFQDNILLYGAGFGLLTLATLVGGLSFFLIEVKANPNIHTVGDGLWWAIVTVTTVGFGDITPVTSLGRILAGVLMVAGMFTLALFAGIVGRTLLNVVLSIREEQVRMIGYFDHVVICGYDAGTLMLLGTIAEEIDLNEHQVVIFAPGERPPEVPPHFAWIQGDPTKESELDKVRLSHAKTAIVVGARNIPPSDADARTILMVFTMRAYIDGHALNAERQRPLYVVSEILDAENVDHALTAGADEVIETTRLGFSLLAHTITQPGTARLMSILGTKGVQNMYVGGVPKGVTIPDGFETVAHAVKAATGALVIGLKNDQGDHVLNPAHDVMVTAKSALIYIAESPVLGEQPEGAE